MTPSPTPSEGAAMLAALAQDIREEADNISPVARTHPAGAMIKWANRIDRIIALRADAQSSGVREREALKAIKLIVCGDKQPRWANDAATYSSRSEIADLIDRALSPDTPREGEKCPSCNGSGVSAYQPEGCSDCYGTGKFQP